MDLKKTLLLVGLSSGLAHADIESTLSASYGSEYLYRGANLGEDHVNLGLTASGEAAGLTWHAGLSHSSSTGGLWDILAAPGISVAETQMMLGVSTSLSESFSLNAGMINTNYGGLTFNDRREIYVGASTALAGIDLSGTVFFNVADNVTGDTYYELSASYHHCMGDGLGATLAVTYGNWDEDPFGALIEDVDFVAISATVTKDLGDDVSGSLGVTHSISDSAVTEDETVVGASVTFSF